MEASQHAERELARLGAGPVRPFSTYDFGRARDERCRSVVLLEARVGSLLPGLRETLPSGFVSFIGTTRWLGEEQHEGVELVVGPGASQFDIPRLARSDAANYDMSTEDLIGRLRKYDGDYGIGIFHAETDTIEFTLLNTPDDVPTFAADLYAFCPDVVDQGLGSVETLEESVEAYGQVYLWWD